MAEAETRKAKEALALVEEAIRKRPKSDANGRLTGSLIDCDCHGSPGATMGGRARANTLLQRPRGGGSFKRRNLNRSERQVVQALWKDIGPFNWRARPLRPPCLKGSAGQPEPPVGADDASSAMLLCGLRVRRLAEVLERVAELAHVSFLHPVAAPVSVATTGQERPKRGARRHGRGVQRSDSPS